MNTEDQVVIDTIVASFVHKDVKPNKCLQASVDKNNQYTCASGRGCATAVVLHNTPCLTDPMTDAATILGLSVAKTIGIAIGFDGGPNSSYGLGPDDTAGINIGKAIADKVFTKPSRNKTIP